MATSAKRNNALSGAQHNVGNTAGTDFTGTISSSSSHVNSVQRNLIETLKINGVDPDCLKPPSDDGYAIVNFRYNTNFIMPYKQAMIVMDNMKNAEIANSSYNTDKITKKASDNIEMTTMSTVTYARIKLANLLGVPLSDIPEDFTYAKPDLGPE